MASTDPVVLVTGVCGNLGRRLLPQMAGYRVIGIDMFPPPPELSGISHFEQLDIGQEHSCARMVQILREHEVHAVVHLAFVIDPLRNGVLDPERMWQINVAGTARVMEAISEANRRGGHIEKFIFVSSVSAYGPETPGEVKEDHPLGARSLAYALHKQQSDEIVQFRATTLGDCATFILRPSIFVGASMQNYLVGALRGTATGKGRLAERARQKGQRLPLLLPRGAAYLEKRFQFVHVDDVSRLIVFLLDRTQYGSTVQIFNLAGRGDSLTMTQCAAVANAKLLRLPGLFLCRMVLRLMWQLGLSGVPPESLPYIVGSYTMDTTRLRFLLGNSYQQTIRYTIEEALADSFRTAEAPREAPAAAVASPTD